MNDYCYGIIISFLGSIPRTKRGRRFLRHWILTSVCVTQANILTSALSTTAHAGASPKAECSPTDAFSHPTALTERLAPFIFGARALNQ